MTVAPRAPGVDGSGARPLAEVVLRHQQLMASFLEQQKQVMLAYLGSRQAAEPVQLASALQPAAARTQPLPALVRAPEPAAEPLPTISAQPLQKAVESRPAAPSAPPIEDLLQRLVALVAERTGYPTEMLAPEQDMEADLGIDSIKRVEILTSFARQFPDLGPGVPEQLRAARTLQNVVQVMRTNLTAGPLTPAPAPQTPAAAPSEPVPETSTQPLPRAIASQPATPSAPSSEELLQRLVALVAERTGYPPEMLAPEQDMEADLGIDSIKRVEILTSFARQFPDPGPGVPEQLRTARTLQDVVQVMRTNLNAGSAPDPQAPAALAGESVPQAAGVADGEGLGRYTLGMKDCPLPDGAAVPIPSGALVITDDGCGYAAALRERLASLGGRPVMVLLEGKAAASEGVYAADLADPAQVEALLRIRQDHGRIGAVVHLLPLRPVPPLQELSAAAFGRLLNQEVKGLFYLLHFASADLRSAPGSWALTCLSFGAPPGDGMLPVPDHPWRGGLIGVIKTATVEWPDVVAKSLVLEKPAVDQAVDRMLAELAGPRQEREAYYRDDSRLVPDPRRPSCGRSGPSWTWAPRT
jgi:acyl carrier protein